MFKLSSFEIQNFVRSPYCSLNTRAAMREANISNKSLSWIQIPRKSQLSVHNNNNNNNNNNNLFIYRFRLYKGLVPQIATKLVEAGQDEHENIMEKKLHCKLQTCRKTENLTLHNNEDLDKAIHQN